VKKGVVLLLTLFFITTISVLVLQNLDDTDTFLKKQNYIVDNTQVLISIKDTKNEVAKLIKRYKDDIDEALETDFFANNYIPINLSNLNVTFKLSKYDSIDINNINEKESNNILRTFNENNVYNFDLFKQIYNEKIEFNSKKSDNNKIQNHKQLDDIINTFIIRSSSDDILRIKDSLGFIKSDNLYELIIKAEYDEAKTMAYYILSQEGEVKYFDISFN